MGTRSAHAPPGGLLGRTRAGTAKGIGRELVGGARQAAGADQNLRTLIKLPPHKADCPYITHRVYMEFGPRSAEVIARSEM